MSVLTLEIKLIITEELEEEKLQRLFANRHGPSTIHLSKVQVHWKFSSTSTSTPVEIKTVLM